MDKMNPIQTALYRIIKRFVFRQTLVLEAIQDLRPDLVMQVPETVTPQERLEMRLKYTRQPSTGYWGKNKEWKYFWHGVGCRLTNVETNERLEWDVGDLQTFDRLWFVNYLEWLLSFDTSDEDVSLVRNWLDEQLTDWRTSNSRNTSIREMIFPILEEMRELGLLFRDEQRYTLLEADTSSS